MLLILGVKRPGLISLPLPCLSCSLKITACDHADVRKPSLGLPSPKRKESWVFFVSRCAY